MLTSTVAGDQPAWVADPGPGSGRVVASFTSANPLATAASFTAQITWGDTHQSAGTITPNGQGGFNVSGSNTYAQPGTFPITVVVTDQFNGMGTGHGTANVRAAVTHFVVTGFPSPTTAGTSSTFTITAVDDLGRTFAGYRGTVHFTSSDPQAALPADYTFTAADNGVHTLPAALLTAGTQSLTATDTQTSSITGAQTGIVVRPLAASTLVVSGFPSPTTAGAPQSVTVTARDRYGNTAAGYLGTVHFTSSDPQAMLPIDYTFTAADLGTHTFSGVALQTAGVQTITATDTVNGSFTGTQGGIVVNPAATSRLQVSDFPSPTMAGSPGAVLVTALDAYGNVSPGYAGTVHLTSSDGRAALEADHPFTAADNGRYAFGATFAMVGTQSITATDTSIPGITGTQSGIVVNPGVADHIVITAPSTVTAGQPFDVTVTVQDEFNNTATGYTGTVNFTVNGNPVGSYTFTSADMGQHTFANRVATRAGTDTVTATDSANASVSGSTTIVVTPAATSALIVAGYPSPTIKEEFHAFTVTAVDAYGNVTPGYTGTVTFSSDDDNASLPPNYTFTAADMGQHAFAAAFSRPGTFYLAATDTASSSITGRQSGIVVVDDSGAPSAGGGGLNGAAFAPLAPAAVSPVSSAQLAPAVNNSNGQPAVGTSAAAVGSGSGAGPAESVDTVLADWDGSLLMDDLTRDRMDSSI
jgi:hypothetical protein